MGRGIVAPITLTIVDPAIRAGDTIYVLTAHGLRAVGTATADGQATISFTTDPAFLVAAVPRLGRVSRAAVLKGRDVDLKLTCGPGAACTGSARLSASKTGFVLAKGTFTMKASKTRTISLAETSSGALYLSAHHAQTLTGTLSVGLLGAKPESYRLTLRR